MIVTKPELGWGCLGLYFWYKSAVQALAARAPFDLVLSMPLSFSLAAMGRYR